MDNDMREWCERHSVQLSRVEGKLDAMKGHDKRITALEHERTRIRTLAGVVTTSVAGAWAKILLAVSVVLLVVLNVGCDPRALPIPDTSPTSTGVWDPDLAPIEPVFSNLLEPECAEVNYEAVEFWRSLGVSYLADPRFASLDDLGWDIRGKVYVNELPPEAGAAECSNAGNVLGTSSRLRNWQGQTIASEIRYSEDGCFGWVARHEWGHSLGLPHSDDEWNLMYPTSLRQSSDLTCDQLAIVGAPCQ